MWKATKPVLTQIFTSKKALAMLVGIIVWVLAQFGLSADPGAVNYLLMFIGVYILGQGAADFRKEGDKAAAEAVKSLGKFSKE